MADLHSNILDVNSPLPTFVSIFIFMQFLNFGVGVGLALPANPGFTAANLYKNLQISVADLRGRPRHVPPTYGPKCSQFHAVFWKIWQNHMLASPPCRVDAPPTGNPGSAPESNWFLIQYASICQKKNLNSDTGLWHVTEKLSTVFIFENSGHFVTTNICKSLSKNRYFNLINIWQYCVYWICKIKLT